MEKKKYYLRPAMLVVEVGPMCLMQGTTGGGGGLPPGQDAEPFGSPGLKLMEDDFWKDDDLISIEGLWKK